MALIAELTLHDTTRADGVDLQRYATVWCQQSIMAAVSDLGLTPSDGGAGMGAAR